MIDITVALLLGLLAAQLAVHRRLLAALWFRQEDPRPVALLRIATGALTLAWLVDLAPLYDYGLSSDGLVTAERARALWGRQGPYSLLFAHGSPAFVRAHALALGLSAVALTIGLVTPAAKWLTWASFVGLAARGGLAAGGEQVFACFLFYLCLARCGHAYSVDAWLHRRRHRPRRTIPAWPRNLMLLQMLAVFCANGVAKHGPLWRRGDAAYLVFNHPHYRPTELWELSAVLGTNVLRAMTWVTHAFELSFFLVVVGLVSRFIGSHPGLMPTGRARWLARALSLAIGLDVIVLASLRLTGGARGSMSFVACILVGVAIALGPLTVALIRRLPSSVRTWLLGRRLWVSLWLLFTAQLAFVLEIGWFTALTMCAAVLLLEGDDLDRVADRWRRSRAPTPVTDPPVPARWRRRAIGALSGVHVLAVVMTVLPSDRPMTSWRRAVDPAVRRWIRQTTLNQHWRMFAPGGAMFVDDLEVVLRRPDGEGIPLGAGLVPPADADSRWGLDKREKIRRRLGNRRSGQRSWPDHARWVCRRFGELAGGDGPSTVELYAVRTPMPPPEALRDLGVAEALARAEAQRRRVLVFEEACPPGSS